jgi:hypothetical protein
MIMVPTTSVQGIFFPLSFPTYGNTFYCYNGQNVKISYRDSSCLSASLIPPSLWELSVHLVGCAKHLE